MARIKLLLFALISITFIYSCVGSGATQKTASTSEYPEWYGGESVVFQDSVVYAYATALDSDSTISAEKAETWAYSVLRSSLSDKLENIRTEAVEEFGDESPLNSTQFVLALRKADDGLDKIFSVSETESKSVEGFKSYRSYVEISCEKEQLLEHIRHRLISGHENAWQQMEDSRAFSNQF